MASMGVGARKEHLEDGGGRRRLGAEQILTPKNSAIAFTMPQSKQAFFKFCHVYLF
jgi:hypothetical protein